MSVSIMMLFKHKFRVVQGLFWASEDLVMRLPAQSVSFVKDAGQKAPESSDASIKQGRSGQAS